MSEHSAVLSGSTFFRLANCAASRELEKKMPPEGDKPYADQGSVYHEAMAEILNSDIAAGKEWDLVGGKHYEYDEQFAITEEGFKQKIVPALDALDEIYDQIEKGGATVVTCLVEQRLSLGSVVEGAFGTCDVLLLTSDGVLWVIDWKFGDGVGVDVEGNYQLGFYAGCAIYDDKKEVKAIADKATSITLAIVQPRVGANRVWEAWPTTLDWVEDLVDIAVATVKKADGSDPPIKAGSHCRWCRAKPICPAHNALATEAISETPSTMDPIRLAAALKRALILQDTIAETFALAQRELENGVAIPGWKLVNKQPRRYWKDEEKAEKALKRKYGVKSAFKRTLMSPTQAEKLGDKFYGHALRKFVDSKSSGTTIAPDSDNRTAVEPHSALLSDALKKMAEDPDAWPTAQAPVTTQE